MPLRKLTFEGLLQRIDLPIEFKELGNLVAREFSLGKVISYEPMLVGYEELNSLLETSKGRFVVKIFSKDKTKESIEGNINALSNFYTNNIPVPKLYSDTKDSLLYQIPDSDTFLCVMDFFDGKKFTDFKPEILDLENLGELLARINNLNFKTKANYDPWITMNLGTEFESKSRYLSEGEMKLIEPVVADFLRVDYKKLTKGVVHFDLHRENALKDSNGKYCILDLASVDYNYTIFDLATFIALFCFDPNNDQVENLKNIYKKVVEKYKSIRPINEYELSVLPLLIRSTYAANLLISSYVQNANMDENPEQTVYYKSLGNKGLKMMLDLNL